MIAWFRLLGVGDIKKYKALFILYIAANSDDENLGTMIIMIITMMMIGVVCIMLHSTQYRTNQTLPIIIMSQFQSHSLMSPKVQE